MVEEMRAKPKSNQFSIFFLNEIKVRVPEKERESKIYREILKYNKERERERERERLVDNRTKLQSEQ